MLPAGFLDRRIVQNDRSSQFSARDGYYATGVALGGVGSQNWTNGYATAVRLAIEETGIPRGSQVMLIGHSFGAYTPSTLPVTRPFNSATPSGNGYSVNVTHVLGAGANSGWMEDLPDGVNAGTTALLMNS